MKMRVPKSLVFSAAIVLQIWFLPLATPSSTTERPENVMGHWTLEEEFPISLSSFLPTAALSKDQATLISTKCVEDSRLLVRALLNRTEWALSMFWASGKLSLDASSNHLIAGSKGILDEPGQFDQCISSKSTSGDFEGQFCSIFLSTLPVTPSLLANKSPKSYKQSVIDEEIFKNPRMTVETKKQNIFAHDNPTDLIIGFCLPSSCSAHDLQTAIAQRIGRNTFRLANQPENSSLYSLATATHERYCHTENKMKEESTFDWLSITFLIAACIIAGLVLTSTVYDLCVISSESHIDKHSIILIDEPESTKMLILKSFSAVKNFNEWLSVKTASVEEITCLHGLRVITLLLVLFVHTSELVFVHSRPIYQEKMLKLMSHWILYPFSNSGVLMQNCLLMGGILTSTSLLKDLNRGNFNLFRFYYHRFLRLTPLYAMILFFVAALAGRLGSGPNWNTVQYQSEDCRAYWWSHLLYINNIFPSDLTFCMPETWYSAVDMQLFLVSPLLIFPLWRWPRKIGPILVLLGLSASLLYTMIIHLKWDIPLVFMMTRASMRNKFPKYFQYYYTQTLNRIPAYLVGIVLGWILNRTKNSQILIQRGTVAFIWIASGIILSMIIYGPFPYVDEKTVPVMNPVFELVYGVFQGTLWSTIISLIIFLCFHGYGGKVNDFLSSKKFVPISRLSYSIYLVNFTLISAYVSYLRMPFNVNLINLIIAYLGMLTFTLILSVILSICVEMPFRNLEKILIFHPNFPSTLTKNKAGKVLISSNTSFPQTKQKSPKGSKDY